MAATPKTPAWFLLTRHWSSLLGVALVTTAWLSWLFVLPQEIRGHASNPYIGIIVFLILPIIFFVGLALIPIGIYFSKRKIRKGLAETKVDHRAALRRLAWFFGVTTLVNILIGTQFTYRAVHVMETPQFCGATCHSMSPEFAAYQNSSHSRVECVECHVAPGAVGWINSKASGVRQLVETVLGTAARPIPPALASSRLVPARETCENCHWPEKFAGVRLRVFSKYAEDEPNTRTETVLLMLIGGNKIVGIHGAHIAPGVHIRFAAADPNRQTIPWVEYRNATTGDSQTFTAPNPPQESAKLFPKIEMQCVDCHNRPTHNFELPDRAMDQALALGQIPTALPFVKKEGVELLKRDWRTRQEAAHKLPASLAGYYQQNYPEIYARRAQDIMQAGKALLAIYQRNVFPELRVFWGTYPNNLGHNDFPGCFRCHDGAHMTPTGKTITQDCGACHEALAMDEASPQILQTLGLAARISQIQKQ